MANIILFIIILLGTRAQAAEPQESQNLRKLGVPACEPFYSGARQDPNLYKLIQSYGAIRFDVHTEVSLRPPLVQHQTEVEMYDQAIRHYIEYCNTIDFQRNSPETVRMILGVQYKEIETWRKAWLTAYNDLVTNEPSLALLSDHGKAMNYYAKTVSDLQEYKASLQRSLRSNPQRPTIKKNGADTSRLIDLCLVQLEKFKKTKVEPLKNAFAGRGASLIHCEAKGLHPTPVDN